LGKKISWGFNKIFVIKKARVNLAFLITDIKIEKSPPFKLRKSSNYLITVTD
tara:strand:+ start:228 stop:383 length:156 start_codon:yes stop_codon:yes gene_type:complete